MASNDPLPWNQVHRVLVVDDDDDTVEVISMMFSLLGHQPQGVGSGRDAIQVARRFDPTLVAVDIRLLDIDGYEVARALRADPALRTCYLVALTGYSRTEDIVRSAEAGFDRHVVKPIELADVRRVLRAADARRARSGIAIAAT